MLVKKHVSQMTKEEIEFLKGKLEEAKVKGTTYHCNEQMKKRKMHFNTYEFNEAMDINNMLEFNNNNGKIAFLFRSTQVVNNKYKGKSNVVFVLGNHMKVVSAWCNNVNDDHATLDMSQYDANASVFDMWTGWVK